MYFLHKKSKFLPLSPKNQLLLLGGNIAPAGNMGSSSMDTVVGTVPQPRCWTPKTAPPISSSVTLDTCPVLTSHTELVATARGNTSENISRKFYWPVMF